MIHRRARLFRGLREREPRTTAAIGTGAVHIAVLGALFASPQEVPVPPPPVYQVELVAAPRPRPQQRRAPEVVQRPAERPTE